MDGRCFGAARPNSLRQALLAAHDVALRHDYRATRLIDLTANNDAQLRKIFKSHPSEPFLGCRISGASFRRSVTF